MPATLQQLEQRAAVLREMLAEVEAELRKARPQPTALEILDEVVFEKRPQDLREAILAEVGRITYRITKTKLFSNLMASGSPYRDYNLYRATLEQLAAEGRIVLRKTQEDHWYISPVPKGTPPPEPTPRDQHNETHMPLNHRSASGFNSYDLRERILAYLRNHGLPGSSVSRTDLCHGTFAWKQFGKGVVDATLEEMAADGLIEVWQAYPGAEKQVRFLKEPELADTDVY